ncbi:hypothetical protein D3C74_388060 [compost metagenome]
MGFMTDLRSAFTEKSDDAHQLLLCIKSSQCKMIIRRLQSDPYSDNGDFELGFICAEKSLRVLQQRLQPEPAVNLRIG